MKWLQCFCKAKRAPSRPALLDMDVLEDRTVLSQVAPLATSVLATIEAASSGPGIVEGPQQVAGPTVSWQNHEGAVRLSRSDSLPFLEARRNEVGLRAFLPLSFPTAANAALPVAPAGAVALALLSPETASWQTSWQAGFSPGEMLATFKGPAGAAWGQDGKVTAVQVVSLGPNGSFKFSVQEFNGFRPGPPGAVWFGTRARGEAAQSGETLEQEENAAPGPNSERHNSGGIVGALASVRNDAGVPLVKDATGNHAPLGALNLATGPGNYAGAGPNRFVPGGFGALISDSRAADGPGLDSAQGALAGLRADGDDPGIDGDTVSRGISAASFDHSIPSASLSPGVSGLIDRATRSDPSVLTAALTQFLEDLEAGADRAVTTSLETPVPRLVAAALLTAALGLARRQAQRPAPAFSLGENERSSGLRFRKRADALAS
jgi:hypothetical protein